MAADPEPLPAGLDLQPGERVLWTGRPEHVPWWFGEDDVNRSMIGLLTLVGPIFLGTLVAVTGGAVWFVVLVALLACASCLYPAAGRVVHRRMRIRRSVYVVTNLRLITVRRCIFGGQVMTESRLYELPTPVVRFGSVFAEPSGMADLRRHGVLGHTTISFYKYLLWPAAAAPPPALIGIADPEAVRDLIDDAELALEPAGELPAQAPEPGAP